MSHMEAGIIAGMLSIPGYVIYNLVVVRRAANPSRTTWWVWTMVSGVQLVSYYHAGARATLVIPMIYFMGRLVTALISLKYGDGGWSKFDRVCLMVVGMSLMLWAVFDSPLIVLVLTLCLDFFGALPTIRKVYQNPESEAAVGWVFWYVGALVNLWAIENWRFSIAIQPLYLVGVNGLMVLLLLRRCCRRHPPKG